MSEKRMKFCKGKCFCLSPSEKVRSRTRSGLAAFCVLLVGCILLLGTSAETLAQNEAASQPAPLLPLKGVPDAELQERINGVLDQIRSFSRVDVSVSEGVVVLEGEVETAVAREKVEELVSRFEGVLFVENQVRQRLEMETRLTPALEKIQQFWNRSLEYLPLIGISLVIITLFWLLALVLTRWEPLYRFLGGESLLGNLIRQIVRTILLFMGILLALEILDLSSLMGALVGTAGLFGLALGFAFREIVENYLAGALLSLRSPFRINDFVSIGGEEGVIMRLNTRELVLMTLDGNHVRIPNSVVFKNIIRNYTWNPRRRFKFSVGVGMEERMLEVQEVGLRTLRAMAGVMADPPPSMQIKGIGDFSMNVQFMGWVDQREADFLKVGSEAIRLVKRAFDEAGIVMPQPSQTVQLVRPEKREDQIGANFSEVEKEARKVDVSPLHQLERQIEEDQATSQERNLLKKDDENRDRHAPKI